MSGSSRSEQPAIFTVPEILSGFRDLGGPRPPAGEVVLSCDPAFNRYTRFWVKEPTLDATHGALETLFLLDKTGLSNALHVKARARSLFTMLRSHFVPETGTFSTNGIEVSAGLYGLQNAIGLIKTIDGCPCEKLLGRERYEAALRRIHQKPELVLRRMEDFLRQCAIGARGGLLDHPEIVPHIPTVTTLHTATSTLGNIYEGEFTKVLDRTVGLDRIEKFIGSCLRQRKESGVAVAAFSIHPDVDELCANTTFFALETLRHIRRESLLTPEVRKKVVSFLTRAVWNKGGGGSSTLGEVPSLNATFFGLRALGRLMEKAKFKAFLGKNLDAIRGFIASCGQQGGFAFTNRPDRYLPNPLATRYAVQIRNFLRKHDFETLPDRDSVRQMIDFIHNELWDQQSRTFRGYPPDRIKGEAGFSSDALYRWRSQSEKPDGEVDAFFGLLADGLQKAWAIESGKVRYGKPEPVRVRGGETVYRRELQAVPTAVQPRYRLRKTTKGSFKLAKVPSTRG